MLNLVVMRVFVYGALVLGIWVYGFSVGNAHAKAKYLEVQNTAIQKQIQHTNELADSFNAAKAKYDEAIKTQSNTISSLLASVRNRTATRVIVSKSPTDRPVCEGNTGLELAKPDAEFLIGEAAESMKWQNKLIECYSQVDELSKAFK